jgi:hypothetical protein
VEETEIQGEEKDWIDSIPEKFLPLFSVDTVEQNKQGKKKDCTSRRSFLDVLPFESSDSSREDTRHLQTSFFIHERRKQQKLVAVSRIIPLSTQMFIPTALPGSVLWVSLRVN